MDENNNILQEEKTADTEVIIPEADITVPETKPRHTASLVLGILSIVFGVLFALAGDVLGVIGLILAIVKRKDYNTKAGLILSIIGLVVSVANQIIGLLVFQ